MLHQRNGTLAMLISGCRSPNALNLGVDPQVEISKLLDSLYYDTVTDPQDGLSLCQS